MKELLYWGVGLISQIHTYIMGLNDSYEYNFTDKQLHFWVIGIMGLLMIFIVYPVFKWLAKSGHEMIIAWIYVFTVILVITFAIEIGQGITGTGNMDFGDIVFGIFGFIAIFAVFAAIRMIFQGITGSRRRRKRKH